MFLSQTLNNLSKNEVVRKGTLHCTIGFDPSVSKMTYYRRPALALQYFLDNLNEIGRRPQNPLVLILLTNGRSTEDRLRLMLTGWKIQAEAWCNSYAIGIGPNADEEEMFLIGGDLQHYQMLPEGSSEGKKFRVFEPIFSRKPKVQSSTINFTHEQQSIYATDETASQRILRCLLSGYVYTSRRWFIM